MFVVRSRSASTRRRQTDQLGHVRADLPSDEARVQGEAVRGRRPGRSERVGLARDARASRREDQKRHAHQLAVGAHYC